jgi:Zn finger protein HypA/HybF involved in hydrogenase expression
METEPKPDWVPIRIKCAACGHRWADWQPTRVPAEVWIASAKAMRCPSCRAGSQRLLMLAEPD